MIVLLQDEFGSAVLIAVATRKYLIPMTSADTIVHQTFDIMRDALRPFVRSVYSKKFGIEASKEIKAIVGGNKGLSLPDNIEDLVLGLDVYACLKLVTRNNGILADGLDKAPNHRQVEYATNYAQELLIARHDWEGHRIGQHSTDDAIRVIDTALRFLRVLSPNDAKLVEDCKRNLELTLAIEQGKSQRNRTLEWVQEDFEQVAKPLSDYLDVVKSLSQTEITSLNAGKLTLIRSLMGHTKSIKHIAFSPDSHHILSSASDGTTRMWDLGSSKSSILVQQSGGPLAISPDGQLMALGCEDNVALFEINTLQQKVVLEGHKWSISDLAFSPDGQYLASASWDTTISIWDTTEFREVHVLQNSRECTSVAFSPDGQLLASTSEDGDVKLWRFEDEEYDVITRDFSWSVKFSPNGNRVFFVSTNGIIAWDIVARREVSRMPVDPDFVTNALAVSPDGSIVAYVGDDKSLKLWFPENSFSGIVMYPLKDVVRAVCFSPDGRLLVCGGGQSTGTSQDQDSHVPDYSLHIWARSANSISKSAG